MAVGGFSSCRRGRIKAVELRYPEEEDEAEPAMQRLGAPMRYTQETRWSKAVLLDSRSSAGEVSGCVGELSHGGCSGLLRGRDEGGAR